MKTVYPHQRFLNIMVCAGLLLLPITLPADDRLAQREAFPDVYAQLKKGEVESVKPRLPALQTYPLYPWIEYEFLLQTIKTASDQQLKAFVESHPNTLMSDRIYEHWGRRLAGISDWSAILQYVPDHLLRDSLRCLRATALVRTGALEQGLSLGQQIWQEATGGLPAECTSLVGELEQAGKLDDTAYWQRIALLIENNEVTAAKALADRLDEDEQSLVELWIQVRRDPSKHLPKAFKRADSAKLREIIVFGLQRAADKKLSTAIPLWEDAKRAFTFTPAESGAVESNFGMWEAWRHDTAGLKRLKAIPAEHRSDVGNVWLARLALRLGEWPTLLDAINAMEPDEAERDIWRYWKARSLHEIGQAAKGDSLLGKLAGDATFYGFLAADRLGQEYQRLLEPPPDRSERIESIRKIAAIERWEEWMALGDTDQARKEWFRTLEAMDKDGMLAAAELATQHGDHNLAIWTVSRTKDWNIVDLRFPLLYQDLVMEQSRSQGIKPEWILGVMRRESAFNANAESHVKALGLMQLMPATARGVGKKLGMKVAGKEDILQPATNVQLGSAYLSEMLQRFKGNYAQATAAYNAGPHRIPKWAPDKLTAADQWIESIPFQETRRYVRAVMAYTTIYDHKLDLKKPQRLSNRLKPIEPE